GTTTLAAADYTLTGSTLVLHPQESALLGPLTGPNSVVGESITIAYTGAVLHSRGEPVYNVCSGTRTSNTCVAQKYAQGTPVLTLGNEPVLYTGGQQAYYSAADPVLVPVQENRITISGTGGLADDVIYSGLASVSVHLGGGANHVTVDTTPAGPTSRGTGGNASGNAVITSHTGLTTITTLGGADQFAIPAIEGAVTLSTGGGNDTVAVGSEAGFYPTISGLWNGKGDANEIYGNLTIDGGDGSDTVTVDDTQDSTPNIGVLSSTRLLGIFGSGGYVTYSNLESLTIDLGNAVTDSQGHPLVVGNTFVVDSTHGSPSVIATTAIDTGNGNDVVDVERISGPTTITTDAGNDTISLGSTTGGSTTGDCGGTGLGASTLDCIAAPLTLDAGAGTNSLFAYDTHDTYADDGVLTDSTLTGLGMELDGSVSYANIQQLGINLSNGNDHFTVASTPQNSTLTLYGGNENPQTNQHNDVINVTSTGGPATIYGGGGNDVLRVNYDEHDSQTFQNGLADTLTLIGGNGGDEYDIGLSGLPNAHGHDQTLINVEDDSPNDPGVNQLLIFGTDAPDYFLLRANQEIVPATAMVAAFRVGSDGQPILDGVMERVNYDGAINGGLELFGRDGNDTFVLDDNLAPTTIFGDAGDDTFQIGQVFASPRDGTNPNNGLAPADYFQTTPTTQGFLSNGISAPTTIFGGTGDDSFTVYHNLAELFLYGQEDDDTFTVRAFVRVNPNDPKAPFTNINGGAGADFISYTVDAPVRIDGGDGLDTLVVLGTE
ncbi:MAG TPA: hypothetical protein VMS63_08155, partial [Gaiellaceae bacterium]|nr:hypothetical protein [Gaiellaceae bacterium]